MSIQTEWSRERVKEMRQHFIAGMSCSLIAKALNTKFRLNLSRSAVIGKVHRLGWQRDRPSAPTIAKPYPLDRRQAAVAASVATRQAKAAAKPPKPAKTRPAPILMALPADAIPLVRLSRLTCRYPVDGEGADTLFCGGPIDGERAYCAGHCKIAYQPPVAKKAQERRDNYNARRFG